MTPDMGELLTKWTESEQTRHTATVSGVAHGPLHGDRADRDRARQGGAARSVQLRPSCRRYAPMSETGGAHRPRASYGAQTRG